MYLLETFIYLLTSLFILDFGSFTIFQACVTMNDLSYVFVGLWAGLHQVHPLSVDLDQGQDVSVPDGLVENLKPGRSVGTEPLGETLFGVLCGDVVLPRLPENNNTTS